MLGHLFGWPLAASSQHDEFFVPSRFLLVPPALDDLMIEDEVDKQDVWKIRNKKVRMAVSYSDVTWSMHVVRRTLVHSKRKPPRNNSNKTIASYSSDVRVSINLYTHFSRRHVHGLVGGIILIDIDAVQLPGRKLGTGPLVVHGGRRPTQHFLLHLLNARFQVRVDGGNGLFRGFARLVKDGGGAGHDDS